MKSIIQKDRLIEQLRKDNQNLRDKIFKIKSVFDVSSAGPNTLEDNETYRGLGGGGSTNRENENPNVTKGGRKKAGTSSVKQAKKSKILPPTTTQKNQNSVNQSKTAK